jgi:predicted metalloprotease
MRYNRKARLDRSQVQDRRGQRSAGGMSGLPGLGGGGGMSGLPVGGGIGGVILFIVIAIVAAKCGAVPGVGGGDSSSSGSSSTDTCLSGADTTRQECRILADVNSIQAFWSDNLSTLSGGTSYEEADIVYFSGATSTACGQATTQTGPFYCPGDKLVYLELGFFDDMLKGQLGASGGDFSDAYVVAHEYGHHVQDLLGTLGKNQSRATGPTSASVRIELQADCYAGLWAHYATTAKDSDGNVFIEDLTDDDISQAIDAATAVGDDHIQQLGNGKVDQEQWTHGSSAERTRWFMTGYQNGTLDSCDTFATSNL